MFVEPLEPPLYEQLSAENIAFPKGVYLTIWTINICSLTILHKVLLDIIAGKVAISNIYYHYCYYVCSRGRDCGG